MAKISHQLSINIPQSQGGNSGVRNASVVPSVSGKGYAACMLIYIDILLCVPGDHSLYCHRAEGSSEDKGLSPFPAPCKYEYNWVFILRQGLTV